MANDYQPLPLLSFIVHKLDDGMHVFRDVPQNHLWYGLETLVNLTNSYHDLVEKEIGEEHGVIEELTEEHMKLIVCALLYVSISWILVKLIQS